MEDVIAELVKAYGTITLPVGFLAMLIARAGYYKFDDNIRRCFIILVFAAINYYSYWSLSWLCEISGCNQSDLLIFVKWLFACIFTISTACIWRKWGSYFYFKFINTKGISNENERGSVLNTIIQDTKVHINGLTIYTTDDRVYSCSNFAWVKQHYNTNLSLIIDETGVSLPVTHYSHKRGEEFIQCELDNNQNGLLYTYIPISEIKAFDFTIQSKK